MSSARLNCVPEGRPWLTNFGSVHSLSSASRSLTLDSIRLLNANYSQEAQKETQNTNKIRMKKAIKRFIISIIGCFLYESSFRHLFAK